MLFPTCITLLLTIAAVTAHQSSPSTSHHSNSIRAVQPTPCFVTGPLPLEAEVENVVKTLGAAVECNKNFDVRKGVPDVGSGGIIFSDIDFAKSKLSPLTFALEKSKTPVDPKAANLHTFQNQLNVYLAVEASLRSQSGTAAAVEALKVPKFFLQLQVPRITGNKVEIKHQTAKVLKNAAGASAEQIAQVKALGT